MCRSTSAALAAVAVAVERVTDLVAAVAEAAKGEAVAVEATGE
jgi:hypothetical protein